MISYIVLLIILLYKIYNGTSFGTECFLRCGNVIYTCCTHQWTWWPIMSNFKPCYYHCPFGWKTSLYKELFYLVGYSYQDITILCFPIKYIPSICGVNISPKYCNETAIVFEWKSVWRVLTNFSKKWNCSIGVNLKGLFIKIKWSNINPLGRREAPVEGRRHEGEGAILDRRFVPYHGKFKRIQSRIEFIYLYIYIYASTAVLMRVASEFWPW